MKTSLFELSIALALLSFWYDPVWVWIGGLGAWAILRLAQLERYSQSKREQDVRLFRPPAS